MMSVETDISNIRLSLFITCLADNLYPEIGQSVVKVLEKAGVKHIDFPAEQTCCGQPAYNSGYQKEAKEVAIKFLNDFRDSDYIVCPSGSCTSMIKVFYESLFRDDSRYAELYESIRNRTHEFTDFLIDVLGKSDVGAVYEGRVAYHDSCHALRELRIGSQPRELLRNVKGLELIEMEMHDACCGFGGTFSVKYHDVSTAMLKEKVDCIIQSGADTVVSTDMGCLMNIGGYIKKNDIPVEVHHISEILALTV